MPHIRKGWPQSGWTLWGIVGRPRASQPSFPYSEAMKDHPGNWTLEELAKYLHDPKSSIPGNKMAFVGIKEHRARQSLGLSSHPIGCALCLAGVTAQGLRVPAEGG